jgi:hypothetical protein
MAKQKKSTTAKPTTTSALAITAKGSAKLSTSQKAFNKLTTRIERLRKEISKKEAQLDEALNLYARSIPPLSAELVQQRRQLLDLLWPFYKGKQLSKSLQPYLKNLLQEYLEAVIQNTPGEPDDELKLIFRELEGQRYEVAKKREEEAMQEELQDVFEKWGVDVELGDEPLSEAEMMQKIAEAQQQMRERQAAQDRKAEERRKNKPKTARQIEQEKLQQATEEMKQKNISTIYRQLAKLFHPDLERDENRRLEKEELMKELVEAYEAKNLHALLTLELKWIHNESNHLETLTEEKLAVYLQILQKQAIELEQEKWQLLHQPRYYHLVEKYGHNLTYPVRAVQEDIEHLQHFKSTFENDIAALQGDKAFTYAKRIVQEWVTEQQQRQQNELFGAIEAMYGKQGRRQ